MLTKHHGEVQIGAADAIGHASRRKGVLTIDGRTRAH